MFVGQWRCAHHLVDGMMKRLVAHFTVQTQQVSPCPVSLCRSDATESKHRDPPFNTPATKTSRAGPIFVRFPICPFGYLYISSRRCVYSRHEHVMPFPSSAIADLVTKNCPVETVLANPASSHTLPVSLLPEDSLNYSSRFCAKFHRA